MEKYIYILVGVIWFVSGLYKAYQKSQSPAASGKKQTNKKSVLETTIDDMIRETKKNMFPENYPTQEGPAKEYTIERPVSQEILINEASFSSEKSTEEIGYREKAKPLSEIDKESTSNSENEMGFFRMDIKTAFIYAEILGKPKALSMN